MYRLYKKNELNFSLVWIISYVVLFSVADSFSASLGTEKIIAAPVAIVFTSLLLVFVKDEKDEFPLKYSPPYLFIERVSQISFIG